MNRFPATLLALLLPLTAAIAEPAFEIRGTLPWHNFLSGPTAWNEDDYRAYLDDLASRGLNFVGFHCYTGGAERYAPYVEPMIRLRYRDVLPEAGFDTSLTARWGYRPLSVQDFAFSTGKLFRGKGAFGADCAVKANSNEERYRRAQVLMRKVVEMAHARGIQVAMGFEFGVHPPELASIVPPESRIPGAMLPDPTHPANIEILQAAVEDILTAYPGIDWIWLWLHEHSMFVAQPKLTGTFGEFYTREKSNFSDAPNEHDVFTGVWSLAQIRQVHRYLARRAPKTRLVIGGWGGGPQLPPVLRGLDRALPTNIVFSCLNPGMGVNGHAPVLAEVARHRPTWAIPWLEGDGWLWHLQLRAASVSDQVRAAHADRLAGVIGIHWRTEEIRQNLEAFAVTALDPEHAPRGEDLYRRYCTARYGETSVSELAPLLSRFETGNQLGLVSSPEFYPYEPAWGRISPALAGELRDAIALLERLKAKTSAVQHRANLDWLADNFRFTLLLDEVGRKIEPAYGLKAKYLRGEVSGAEFRQQAEAAHRDLSSAPLERLFKTFARRVRSRGELGELSSLNQKLWLQYRELDRFLANTVEKAATSLSGAGVDSSEAKPVVAPDFGPNVLIFDASMTNIQSRIDAVFSQQERSQFGSNRFALFFKPGKYDLDVQVGFYTQVLGLGQSPDDVAITGAVRCKARWMANNNATCNFWRSVENLSVTPTQDQGINIWAVSQATALRRMHVKGNLNLWDGGWSSGGFIADCKIDGQVNSGSQQQWFSRNAEWGGWKGANWNMVFVGIANPPSGRWPDPPYTVIERTPVIREKPYLFIDERGRYFVMVPSLNTNGARGTTWASAQTPGTAIPIDRFYLARPEADNAVSINRALNSGKNLLLTPGIYHLENCIQVTNSGTIVLGLGYPTLQVESGTAALAVSDVDGVKVAGILIEAGATNSDTLMQVGELGSRKAHATDPVFLWDIFCRVGGAQAGKSTCMVTINSHNVVGDNLWLWRADHGQGAGWKSNPNKHGLIVNGDNVTLYGLFVEHTQEYQTIWNGNGGRVYFYQSEMPYDPPSQEAWKHGEVNGYASYKVADTVTTHEAWGLGVYCVFYAAPVVSENAIETPVAPGVKMHHMVTIRLSGRPNSGINHVINGTGDAVITTRKAVVN